MRRIFKQYCRASGVLNYYSMDLAFSSRRHLAKKSQKIKAMMSETKEIQATGTDHPVLTTLALQTAVNTSSMGSMVLHCFFRFKKNDQRAVMAIRGDIKVH